jgi:hypothetical protein
MTLTVKIEPALERALEERCALDGSTKSALVRALIERYVQGGPRKTPWQAYLDVHGGVAPKPSRARKFGAAQHSRLIKDKLRAQRNRAR